MLFTRARPRSCISLNSQCTVAGQAALALIWLPEWHWMHCSWGHWGHGGQLLVKSFWHSLQQAQPRLREHKTLHLRSIHCPRGKFRHPGPLPLACYSNRQTPSDWAHPLCTGGSAGHLLLIWPGNPSCTVSAVQKGTVSIFLPTSINMRFQRPL